MGCDIHLYVEAKKNGQWVSVDEWEKEDDVESMSVHYSKRFYSDRNYDLFAILANVRNGYGFAGCDTGDGFIPISDPKGLPEDVSDEVKSASDGWDIDGHSHSYHTLADIMAFDWTRTTKKRGWVSAIEYFEWASWRRDNGEGPKNYCGGISGPSIDHLSENDMAARIQFIKSETEDSSLWHERVQSDLENCYCQIEWGTPYYLAASDFLGQTLPRLWRFGKPEDVRIVFWFDN